MNISFRFLLLTVFVMLFYCKTYSQYVLNMQNQIPPSELGCGHWCWLHVTVNIACFYGEECPDKLEVADYARSINWIYVDPSVTSCYLTPDSCCRGASSPIYNHYGILAKYAGILTNDELRNEFYYNKPVSIYVPGHVFVAYGIDGSDSIYIYDGGYGQWKRKRDNIYPNKSWTSSEIMKFSPNWSSNNEIVGSFNNSRCFSASSSISTSSVFQKTPSNPNTQYFQFKTNGSVYLNGGFTVHPGCDLTIVTNNSNCP